MSTENESHRFEDILPAGKEPDAKLRERAVRMGQVRAHSPETAGALDWYVLSTHATLRARHRALGQNVQELRVIHNELRRQITKLTAPPLFPVTFLRPVETGIGLLAEIYHGGGWRLVHLSDGVDVRDLIPGQTVYLSHELNAVLGVGPPGLTETGAIATVERMLDDGRVALRDRDEQVLVHTARAVNEARISPGDSVRWNRDMMLALEPVQGSAPTELFVTEYLSAQPVQPLGGLAGEVAQVIALFTQGIARPDLATHYGLTRANTLLLVGPPGNGKTSIARIVGSALAAATGEQCRFASIKGAQLESPWVGTTQQNVRELFRELNRHDTPTLLFIDEVDAIGRIRGSTGGHHSDKFLSAYLTEIDGLERQRGSLGIIASTNRKDLIDQALLERLSGMELFIGRPDMEAALEIFAIHLPPSLPYGPNGAEAEHTRETIIEAAVSTLYSPNADNDIAELRFRDGSSRPVAARQLLSGRTIEQICTQARRSAFRRHAEGGMPGVRLEDMEAAVAAGLERLASTLSVANARAMLSDLPQDPDVVAVEPVRRRFATHRYLHGAAHG